MGKYISWAIIVGFLIAVHYIPELAFGTIMLAPFVVIFFLKPITELSKKGRSR